MAHGQPIHVTLSDYICLCNHVLYCMKKVARLSNREFTHLCVTCESEITIKAAEYCIIS